MPDHVHLVVSPLVEHDGRRYDVREIVKAIKSVSAHSVNRTLGVRGSLWQAGAFDRIVRATEDVEERIEYVRQNPVRKRLVKEPDDYPWLWCAWE